MKELPSQTSELPFDRARENGCLPMNKRRTFLSTWVSGTLQYGSLQGQGHVKDRSHSKDVRCTLVGLSFIPGIPIPQLWNKLLVSSCKSSSDGRGPEGRVSLVSPILPYRNPSFPLSGVGLGCVVGRGRMGTQGGRK